MTRIAACFLADFISFLHFSRMLRLRRALLLLSVYCIGFMSISANAQQVLREEQRKFLAPQERGIPKVLNAEGMVFKGFSYYPSLNISTIYSSNIYSQNDNEIDDYITRYTPSLRIAKDYKKWRLAADARAAIERYRDISSENKEDYFLSFNSDYEISSRWNLPVRFEHKVTSRDRGDPLASRTTTEPLKIAETTFNTGLSKRFNRFILSLNGSYEQQLYDDGTALQDGSPIINKDNDFKSYGVRLGGKYELLRGADGKPEHIIFGHVTYKDSRYARRNFVNGDFSGRLRDNIGMSGFLGLETSYKDRFFANIGLGYLKTSYEEEGIDDVKEFDFSAEVEYSLTPKWMIGALIDREVSEDTDIIEGEVVTTYNFFSEYEIFSRLYADFEYEFEEREIEQLDQKEDSHRFDFGILYLLNKNLRARLGASFEDNQSTEETDNFEKHQILFSVIGRL